MDVLIYEATYRMDNVFAKGYIILNDEYVEGIFANDYMAIYSETPGTIIITLRTLSVEVINPPWKRISYTSHDFSMTGEMLCPGHKYIFFSNINLDDLYLDISLNTVEGEMADYLVELLQKLRCISQI